MMKKIESLVETGVSASLSRSKIPLTLDGRPMEAIEGETIAAVISRSAENYCHVSVQGQHRSPFCGMGICQECRVIVNGRRRLACQTLCQPGMIVERTL